MTLRKCLFWCHLAAGVSAGIVIFIMSVTGVLLTYERQIIAWADTRHYRAAPPSAGAPRLPMEAIIAKAYDAEPGTAFTTVIVRADSSAPVGLGAGQRMLYVNPYTAQVMGNGSPGVRRFFRLVTDWHRNARARRGTARDRPRDHWRVQPCVPVHRRQRLLSLVAADLDASTRAQPHDVQRFGAWQSP